MSGPARSASHASRSPSDSGPVPVAVSGALGRLGQRVVHHLASDPEIRLTGALDAPGSTSVGGPHPECPGLLVLDDPARALEGAGVLVEASLPEPAVQHAELAAERGIGVLVAVTGLSPSQDQRLTELAGRVPVLVTSNLSMGVSALAHLCREAARGLGYDVEIVETHHTAKKDAPSGTALMLARAVADSRGWGSDVFRFGREGQTGPRPEREIGIHALRAGDVVGEHRVIFAGPGERLELIHSAQSRDCFARGVAPAVKYIYRKSPGRYTMDDVWRAALHAR